MASVARRGKIWFGMAPWITQCPKFLMVAAVWGMCLLLSSCDPSSEGLDAEETVAYEGVNRYFTVHLPAGYDGKTSLPLLVVLHGSYQTTDDIKYITGFDSLADEKGFLALYPLAYENTWNDGRAVAGIPAYDLGIDDVSFISAAIDRVIGSFSVDTRRIYIAGMSNGAMMAHRMALAQPQRFAAMAAVAGTIPENLTALYGTGAPVPALLMHGDQDPLVPYEGGVLNPSLPMGVVLSAPGSATYWAERNQCVTTPATDSLPNSNWFDGTNVYRQTYAPLTGDAPVLLYRIAGGGHSWPGSPRALILVTDGRICRDIDASTVIWSFFAQYTRPAQ